jgi:hypothetical protein
MYVGTPHHWQFFKVHTISRSTHGLLMTRTKLFRQQAEIINDDNENVLNIGHGEA